MGVAYIIRRYASNEFCAIFAASSLKQDPPFAKAFTYTWVSAAAVCVLFGAPRIARSLKSGRLWAAIRGIGEDYGSNSYESIDVASLSEKFSTGRSPPAFTTRLRGWMSVLASWSLYEPPFLRLDVGQREHIPHVVLGLVLTDLVVC